MPFTLVYVVPYALQVIYVYNTWFIALYQECVFAFMQIALCMFAFAI